MESQSIVEAKNNEVFNNKVYYGEYSLMHWINLILKKNIILPDYQRFFVWNESKTKMLIETLKKRYFVPPITIGVFKNENKHENLILDGQQRLTSILLAHLGLFPDKESFKMNKETFVDDNDNLVEEDMLDNILEWNFKQLTSKGNTKIQILNKIKELQMSDKIKAGFYKEVDFNIEEEFFKKTYLGFSYLVPQVTDIKVQQRFYSSVFRNINIQGETLLPQESRASLYYLDKDLVEYFDPDFIKNILFNNKGNDSRVDFVRYLALLSQYYKGESADNVAHGFARKMEKYYEEYINSVVGEDSSNLFAEFSSIIKDKKYQDILGILKEYVESLRILGPYNSIIDLDLHLFGLIYVIVFQKKGINLDKKEDLLKEIDTITKELRKDHLHVKSPSALKYLRKRIKESISIYERYAV